MSFQSHGPFFSACHLVVVSSSEFVCAVAEGPAQEPALALTFKDAQLKWGPCPAFIPKGCEIAVLHGDPTKENADIFFKSARKLHNSSLLAHLGGAYGSRIGELSVTYDGQKTVVLKPGTCAYGPAKLPHKASCAKGNVVSYLSR